MVEYDLSTSAIDKLKNLLLHTDVEGPYYLLFKAVLKLKIAIPRLSNRGAL